MMPFSEINIGDIYSNPIHRGFGKYSGLEWVVVDKKDGMIKIQGHKYSTSDPFGPSIWKNHTDRMFCESWRVSSVSSMV